MASPDTGADEAGIPNTVDIPDLTALAQDVGLLREELHTWIDRVIALEARLDDGEAVHERALETRDRELSRLRDQLRDAEYERYDLERKLTSLKSEVGRGATYGRW